MMSLPWDLLETFVWVMRTGSLSAAARALNVTQPTVRRRVDELEQALAAVLFTRAPHGLIPTDAATRMLPLVEAMEANARAIARQTSAADAEPRGTVRVACSRVMGAEVVPGLLAPLLEAWPELTLELVVSNHAENLLRRDADVAVRMFDPLQESLSARRVGAVPVALFAHVSLVEKAGIPQDWNDLTQRYRLLLGDRDLTLERALDAVGLSVPGHARQLRSDDELTQLAALRAGLGAGVCQVPIARRDPTLVRLLPNLSFPMPVWVVRHEDQRPIHRVSLVFDALVEGLRGWVEAGGR